MNPWLYPWIHPPSEKFQQLAGKFFGNVSQYCDTVTCGEYVHVDVTKKRSSNASHHRRSLKTSPQVMRTIQETHHCCIIKRTTQLVAFDRAIDVTHEGERGSEPHSPEHEEEPIADARHEPKVEGGLHEPRHVGSSVVVVEGVPEDEQARGASAQDRPAPHGASGTRKWRFEEGP